MFMLLSLAVVGGLAWYMTEPGERVQAANAIRAWIEACARRVLRLRRTPTPLDPLLRARTRFIVVTPLLALAHIVVFLGIAGTAGGPGDPGRLIEWGASIGTRTTNGEWWRLLTATFVHAGVWHLVVNVAALVAVGRLLERAVGPFALATTYLAASLLAGLAALAANPVAPLAGASAGICGLFGLLIATWMWGTVQRSESTIRIRSVARLAPFTLGFVVHHTWTNGVFSGPEQLAAGIGFLAGVVLSRRAAEGWAPLRHVTVMAAVVLCLTTIAAVPLRGIADVAPEVARVVALEAHHTKAYDEVIGQVTNGRAPRRDAVSLIESRILPDLAAASARLAQLERVPKQHAALITSAQDYLERRTRSWRLRAEGNRQSRNRTLREADEEERAARAILRGLKN